MRLNLMKSKTLCLTRKYSDTKWKDFKAKNIRLEHTKSKKSLSCFDDKRFVLNDGIHTLAYFAEEKVWDTLSLLKTEGRWVNLFDLWLKITFWGCLLGSVLKNILHWKSQLLFFPSQHLILFKIVSIVNNWK